MLLRANSLVRGISGIRLRVLERFEIFLNADVTPHVHEFGSIGASGDLVPLALYRRLPHRSRRCIQSRFQGARRWIPSPPSFTPWP